MLKCLHRESDHLTIRDHQMTHITYTDTCEYVTNSVGRLFLPENDKT